MKKLDPFSEFELDPDPKHWQILIKQNFRIITYHKYRPCQLTTRGDFFGEWDLVIKVKPVLSSRSAAPKSRLWKLFTFFLTQYGITGNLSKCCGAKIIYFNSSIVPMEVGIFFSSSSKLAAEIFIKRWFRFRLHFSNNFGFPRLRNTALSNTSVNVELIFWLSWGECSAQF